MLHRWFLCILFGLGGTSTLLAQPLAQDGRLDLSQSNLATGELYSLDGQWLFYWQQFIESDPKAKSIQTETKANQLEPEANQQKPKANQLQPKPVLTTVPAPKWNDIEIDGESIGGFGYGSYQLRLVLPPGTGQVTIKYKDQATSFRMYFNGKLVASNGSPGPSAEETISRFVPGEVTVGNLQPVNNLVMEIANYSHYKGGFWEGLTIGTPEAVRQLERRKTWFDLFLVGSLIIMGFYHIGLYYTRRSESSPMWFSLLCFVIALRVLITDERILFQLFPAIPWTVGNRLEYLTVYSSLFILSKFLTRLFPEEFTERRGLFFEVPSVILLVAIVVLPDNLYTQTLTLFWMILATGIVYVAFRLGRALGQGKKGAAGFLVGMMLFLAGVVNDALVAEGAIHTLSLAPLGLFLFIFFQAFLLSSRFTSAFLSVEMLSESLAKTNKAYSRFVPRDVLGLLNRKDITEVQLGDQAEINMTVLVSDIRDYTNLADTLSPKENFDFLNDYLHRMEPVIQKHNGFIDKYMGDGILALFPESAENAVDAAIQMQTAVDDFNNERKARGEFTISVGMGIHRGPLMLGTVGGQNRMEATVVADAVNLTARLESLTKTFKTRIIISDATFRGIQKVGRHNYHYRYLGTVNVKGKKEPISIIELLDGMDPDKMDAIERIRPRFEAGIHLYADGKFESALEEFQTAIDIMPEDAAAAYYVKLCQDKIAAVGEVQ